MKPFGYALFLTVPLLVVSQASSAACIPGEVASGHLSSLAGKAHTSGAFQYAFTLSEDPSSAITTPEGIITSSQVRAFGMLLKLAKSRGLLVTISCDKAAGQMDYLAVDPS